MKEPKSTTISLQLADHSITYPKGVVKDVLVKVDKFIFPQILWCWTWRRMKMYRSFSDDLSFATGKTLIDVQ